MLLELTEMLARIHSGFGVFQYLTFRTVVSTMTALLISLLVGPTMIKKLSHYQIGQVVRDLGPETHLTKAGTPTMGGALILVSIATATLLWCDLSNRYVWIVLGVVVSFGGIGALDDYLKISEKSSRGLSAGRKYLWQSVFGFVAAVVLYPTAEMPAETALIAPSPLRSMHGT